MYLEWILLMSFQETEIIQTAVVCPHRDNCYTTLRTQQDHDSLWKHQTQVTFSTYSSNLRQADFIFLKITSLVQLPSQLI